jgi:metallo-beta-lactamase class B
MRVAPIIAGFAALTAALGVSLSATAPAAGDSAPRLSLAALAEAEPPSTIATQREIWNRPAEPFHVIGNVYYVGTKGLSSWLISTSKGLILIDGALPESAPQIEQHIVALGFKLKDVKILLNSHAHFDHSGGLAQLKRDTGAILIASAGDKVSLETGTYLGSEDVHAFDAPPVRVDRIVADGGTVTLGTTVLTAHLTPGHTRGCTSYTLSVIEDAVSHGVIFFCSATVAANHLAPKEQYPGIVADYRHTFELTKNVGADVFLAPHQEFFHLWDKRARMTAGQPNPFVDPNELQTFIAASQAAFEKELARQQGKSA